MRVGTVIGGPVYGEVPAYAVPVPAAPAIRLRVSAFIALAVAVGLALRLLAARHDLWLDEIWSIDLVQGLSSPDQVFWRISHDNNHFLNSLWLYALGPDRDPILYRLPAVLMGTLSVLAAARIGLRRSAATGIAAAALVSTSTLLVNYGSEARGYAGLILALLVAVDAFDRVIDHWVGETPAAALAGTVRQRWILGTAIGAGMLFHLTMAAALPLFGVVALLRLRGAGRSWGTAADDALTILRPALILMVPAAVSVAGGIVARTGFQIGGATPFTLEHALLGVGEALRLVSGLPQAVPPWLACVACGLGVTIASALWLGPTHRWLAIVGPVLLPGCLIALRLPNLEFPRYFLIPATLVVVVLAEVAGGLWDRGTRASRIAAVAMIAAIVLGQLPTLHGLLTLGRGSYSAVLERMTAAEPAAYASNARFRVETVADFVAARQHRSIDYVASADVCAARPRWYIDADEAPAPTAPDRVDLGPSSCRMSFEKIATYPTSALSGMAWTLYRRSD